MVVRSGYDINKMCCLYMDGIGWFNETHHECYVGHGADKNAKHVKFARNENGEYDENGTFSDEIAMYCTFKYNKQVQLMLGVTMKQDSEDHIGICWQNSTNNKRLQQDESKRNQTQVNKLKGKSSF